MHRITKKREPSRGAFACALIVALAWPGAAGAQHEHHHPRPAGKGGDSADATVERHQDAGRSQRIVQNGVAIDLFLEHQGSTSVPAVEGRDALLRLRVTDAATGAPLPDLHPIAWIDRQRGEGPTNQEQCLQKIGTYAEGSMRARPAVDLNSYHLLAMTSEGTILVIDPIVGFGRTRLLTSVPLGAPTEDWALTADGRRLLVTLPSRDRVAVVDTDTWKVLDRLEVGAKPGRLLPQPDGSRIWVTLEDGVAALDAAGLQVVRRVPTGGAPTAMAFSPDSRLAFVLTPEAERVTVLDTETGASTRELITGDQPTDLAISPAVAAVFVTHADGSIAVIDGGTLRFTGHIPIAPGARSIRFPPQEDHGHHGHGFAPERGRYGYVVNPAANLVHVLDAVKGEIVHTIEVPTGPDQVGFTASFAHLRSARTAQVRMLPLSDPRSNATGALDIFDAGFAPPGFSTAVRLDDVFAQAPEMPDALYAVNPKEKMIYYFHYMEGMPVPAGGFTTYGYEPVAVRLSGKNLRETDPGTYAATVRLPDHGDYDVILYLAEPRVVHCFGFDIEPDPARQAVSPRLVLEALGEVGALQVGEQDFRFRLVDRTSREPRGGLDDVLLVLAGTGGWSQRVTARPLGDGTYDARLKLDRPGTYYLVFQVESLGLELGGRTPLVLRVRDD
jgi:DNA-binding beta-propeller fold protein YncE